MPFIDNSYWCAAISTEVNVRTGIEPQEKHNSQTLRIEVKMYLPISTIISLRQIEDVADYDRIYKVIKDLENQPHTDLLEQIAVKIAAKCFDDQRINAAEITITKPDIYRGAATPKIIFAATKQDWDTYFKSHNGGNL